MKNWIKHLQFSILILLIVTESTASIPNAKIHVFQDYSTIGYFIEKINNSNNFLIAGTLLKTPVWDACSNSLDSSDLHFLIVDENGDILTNKVLNSGANDIAYDVTTYNESMNQFLLTTSTNDVQSLCGSMASITYFVLDFSGNILQKHSFEPYDQPVISSGYFCNFIGIRDIRPFKTIVTEDGITTVGMQKDLFSLTINPLPINHLIKTGFVKHMDINFNPVWDKLVLNNSNNMPCYMLPSGIVGNDFDILDNIIEIPGKGYFVSGSTTVSKNNGAYFDEGVAALQLDYSGNLIHDWSHFSTNQPNLNLNSADAIFSAQDKLIYLLENDQYNSTIRVLSLDPYSNTLVNSHTLYNSNMDVRVMAYSILEDSENPENLIISGLSDQISGDISGFGLSPFMMVLNKTSNISDIIWRQQAWVLNNSNYELRGDNVQQLNSTIPMIHTQKMMAQFNDLPDHKIMLVGYDWVSSLGQFGLKLITFENALNGNSIENSCAFFQYESIVIESENLDFKVTQFPTESNVGQLEHYEINTFFQEFDCFQNPIAEKNLSSDDEKNSLNSDSKLNLIASERYLDKINEISVINSSGQILLRTNNLDAESIKNKINSFPLGLYFVRIVYSSGKVVNKKIVN